MSDIDPVPVDSLIALDPNRPIREADICLSKRLRTVTKLQRPTANVHLMDSLDAYLRILDRTPSLAAVY